MSVLWPASSTRATMTTRRVFIILLAFVASSLAQDSSGDKDSPTPKVEIMCTPHTGGSPGNPAPTLDKDFELTVEAKVKQTGYVVLLREYYDSATRRGAVVRTHQDMQQKWIYKYSSSKEDLEDLEYSYLIDDHNRCSTATGHIQYFVYDYLHSKQAKHFSGPSRLLKFLTADNQEYIKDNTTVRFIPANHWRACVKVLGVLLKLDYYFSKKTEITPCGKRGIPLRVDLNATKNWQTGKFHNSYDFMFYRPGRVQDQSIFEVPKRVVCYGLYGQKTRPPPPKSFSANIVMVYPGVKFSMIRRQHFDHNAKLNSYDATILPGTNYANRFGVNYVKIVHDYNTGIQYIIDAEKKNCTIEVLGKDKETNYDFDGPWDPSHMLFNHTSELFDLSGFNFSYQGQRMERDIPVEVWAARRAGFPRTWLKTTIEMYYTQNNWMTEAGSHGERNVLIALYHHTVPVYERPRDAFSYNIPASTHIYNHRNVVPDFSVFDVEPCFKDPKHFRRMSFQIPAGKLTSVAGRRRTLLERAARTYIANVTGVELLRVNRLKVVATTDNQVEIQFNLLEWLPPREGSNPAWSNRVSLDKAVRKLHEAIDGSGKEPIRLGTKKKLKEIYVKRGSLAVSSGPIETTGVIVHGYSTVALIGAGFGMVIVGGVVGLAIAFTLWKTRLLLPYFPH